VSIAATVPTALNRSHIAEPDAGYVVYDRMRTLALSTRLSKVEMSEPKVSYSKTARTDANRTKGLAVGLLKLSN
jgi:hypothetical protein